MRVAFALLLVACAACASADRLILIPTGRKIPQNAVRGEFLFSGRKPDTTQGFFGFGVGRSFEAELLYERLSPNPRFGSFSVAYNYVEPVVDLVPGITVGLRDVLNRTEFGRSFYIALTYRIGLQGDYNSDIPMEFTLGGGTGRIRGAFVGVMLPFADSFRLIGEHDSRRITAGFEVRPVKGLSLRALFRENQTLWGVGYLLRF